MAREVKVSGRTVYLTDRDEWEETPTEPAPRAGPYALSDEVKATMLKGLRREAEAERQRIAEEGRMFGFEVSGFVEHETRCSGCGKIATGPEKVPIQLGRHVSHYVPAPGGWRKCGEWR